MLALTLTLGGCGDFNESRFNPRNWFGKAEPAPQPYDPEQFEPRRDPRPLIDQVTALSLDKIPGGAILRATGLPPTQGYWSAELVAVEGRGIAENVLVFDFRVVPPRDPGAPGHPASRELVVATYLTSNELAGIARIVVRGASGERSVRP